MTQVEWLRKRRAAITALADTIARRTLSSALPHDEYLVRVGRYKQLQQMISWFDTEAKKLMGGEDDNDSGVNDLGDADFDPPRPTRQPAARPTRARRPREWGG